MEKQEFKTALKKLLNIELFFLITSYFYGSIFSLIRNHRRNTHEMVGYYPYGDYSYIPLYRHEYALLGLIPSTYLNIGNLFFLSKNRELLKQNKKTLWLLPILMTILIFGIFFIVFEIFTQGDGFYVANSILYNVHSEKKKGYKKTKN